MGPARETPWIPRRSEPGGRPRRCGTTRDGGAERGWRERPAAPPRRRSRALGARPRSLTRGSGGSGRGARHALGHLGRVRVHGAGSGDRADVCGRVVLMAARRRRPASVRQLRRGAMLRRVAVTVVAAARVVAAEIAATLSPAPVHQARRQRPARVRARYPVPEPGEPELPATTNVSLAARSAAVSFVRDYTLWSGCRVATMPGLDMTRRVLGLLEHGDRLVTGDVANAVASVRIARGSRDTYVVTSTIGNFLVGKQRSRACE